MKWKVPLRAARFVHIEKWIERLGWNYAQLGDHFEIGKRATSFDLEVPEHAPPLLGERPFVTLSQSVADALLFKATSSSINPLVSSVSSGAHVLRMLAAARGRGNFSRLVLLLAYHLRLCRLILTFKLRTNMASKSCLLGQAPCARVTSEPTTERGQTKHNPINVLASYVSDRTVHMPVEAIRLLTALGACLSCASPSPPYNHWSSFKPRNHCRFVCTYHFTSIQQTRPPQWDLELYFLVGQRTGPFRSLRHGKVPCSF